MEDKDKRSTLFTVLDTENAMIWAAFIAVLGLICVYIYECISKNWIKAFLLMTNHVPRILSIMTIFIIIKEGGDIVFFRRTARLKKQYRDEGRVEGIIYAVENPEECKEWANNGRNPKKMPSVTSRKSKKSKKS